jgi:hypothetical protein
MEQLMDVVAGLDAVEAYETFITDNDLVPLEKSPASTVAFDNPLHTMDPTATTNVATELDPASWWHSDEPFPFAGASMIARERIGMYSSPNCKRHKGTLKKGHAFAVVTIQEVPESELPAAVTGKAQADDGAPVPEDGGEGPDRVVGMLEIILAKSRKVAWIQPLSNEGKPLVEMNVGKFAEQGSSIDKEKLQSTQATRTGMKYRDGRDEAGDGEAFDVVETAQLSSMMQI